MECVLLQLVCECCEEADPYPALEKLLSLVREEQLSEAALLTLLLTLQQQASSSFPSPLLPLLEEAQSRLTAGGELCEWISLSIKNKGCTNKQMYISNCDYCECFCNCNLI